MAVRRRSDTKQWIYRTTVRLPNGKKKRIFGTPEINTKSAAEEEERLHIARLKNPRPEVPLYSEWFNGRFWREWVVARANKPSETTAKRSVYDNHLGPEFGDKPLDEIDIAAIARFRGRLLTETDKKGALLRGKKTINNILAVLSKSLRYAEDVELIARAPKVGLFKVERPEIEPWDFDQYSAILNTAKAYKREWWIGVCLAGEAGLRVGEVKALRWQDVDLKARTITVAQQVRHGKTTTPKGRTRRVVPMTALLHDVLAQQKSRAGYVVRTGLGEPVEDSAAEWAIEYICRSAGLPVKKWHTLRHTFGTHAALLGVNAFSLQAWMGHKGLTETLLYVHHARDHARETPRRVLEAAGAELQPDRRIVLQMGARFCATPVPARKTNRRGSGYERERVIKSGLAHSPSRRAPFSPEPRKLLHLA